ncbi:MAG: cardiolipin synthase [Gemmatimonadaceae bacterium]|nr:cardiolipin synthase [Gemmatimonadaceae bacterium]
MTLPVWGFVTAIAYGVSWLIVLASLFVVPRNRRPGSATAWLMLIFLVPYVGLVLFWLIGSPKLSRRRRELQRGIDERIAAAVSAVQHDPILGPVFAPPISARAEPLVRLASNLGGMPVCVGNRIELLPDYDEAIASLTRAVSSALEYVHVEFYIMAMDATTEPFFVALEQAVRRGVKVRLLMDHIGSHKYPGRAAMGERLTRAGVEWRWMLPLRPFSNHWNRPDLRNHRKILVADGHTAFTGSMNMIDRSYLLARNRRRGLYYVDLHSRITGPLVAELDAVFRTDWYSETGEVLGPPPVSCSGANTVLGQVLPSGSGYADDNNRKVFVALIHAARERLVITSPYFVPDEALMTAITSAAQRGVHVTLYSSSVVDQYLVSHAQRSYYEQLLQAGVEIRLLRSPVLLHAKHLTVDDDLAVIGSSNLDMRSLTLNLEITLLAYDRGVVADLRRVEAAYHPQTDVLDLATWRARPLAGQLLDNLARLTAALQ